MKWLKHGYFSEEDAVAEQHTFATILTQAIASSGLSLTDIVTALDKQGLSLSAASLSYWKTGKSLPTRKSSRPVLTALETLCSLTPGTLIEAAKSDSQVNSNRQILRFATPPRTPDNVRTLIPSDLKDIDSEIQWEYEAEREILVDSYHISADFKTIQSEVMILARVTNPSHSHIHISAYAHDNEDKYSDNETGMRYLEGATIGNVIRHEDSRAITLRLDLPEERKVGDLHRIFYLPAPFQHAQPSTETPGRAFAWPLRMYNCNVFFEGDVPNNIEWVTQEAQEHAGSSVRQITSQRITPNGNTVQVSLENVQGLRGNFRWALP